MSTTGKAPRQYRFRGGTITAKDAADHFGVSIKTMYNRLAKCGDNMDAAWDYYEKRNGGGKSDMRKISMKDEEAKRRAVDEIAGILCGSAIAEDETARVMRVDGETGTIQPMDGEIPEADQIEPKPARLIRNVPQEIRPVMPAKGGVAVGSVQSDPEKHSLKLYNGAIDALEALLQDGIDDNAATEKAEDLLNHLRQVRMNAFEHMVPWAKLAEAAL